MRYLKKEKFLQQEISCVIISLAPPRKNVDGFPARK
jgi:hypothetical protein